MMRKCCVEFIGTFFLVLTVGFTVLKPGDAGVMAPLAIGSVLMVMVFASGHISGGHYNPAVTLAVLVRGKSTPPDTLAYWVAQVLGGAAAAGIVLYTKGSPSVTAATPDVPKALLVEFLYTFALCYVVLNVATAQGTSVIPSTGWPSASPCLPEPTPWA
jgi:aquaporin Z